MRYIFSKLVNVFNVVGKIYTKYTILYLKEKNKEWI